VNFADKEYRKPPFPASFFLKPTKGICRWCGKPVNEKRRTFWHGACKKEFYAVYFPSDLEIRNKYNGRCAVCGKSQKETLSPHEYDHIIPLKDAPKELKYWTNENRQFICHKCHVEKSRLENIERNKRKRGQGVLEFNEKEAK
jgi:5-methylcytosine-specific restriction endonuclease McrA